MDNEQCCRLINLYGAKDLLWNSKSPHYHNKSSRQDAWNEIGSEMGLPIADLKKKMTTLMASYRREKSRINKSLITGSGANEVYTSKWFAFENFNFMKDRDLPNETYDTMPDDIPATQNIIIDSSNDEEPTTPSATDVPKNITEPQDIYKAPSTPKYKKNKRKQNAEEESPMLKKAFQILTESSTSSAGDPYFTYGQYIANELRKYDQYTLAYVKQALNNVIFEADLGRYSHYGYCTHNHSSQNSTPSPSPSPQPSVLSNETPVPSPQAWIPLSLQTSTLSPQPRTIGLQTPDITSPLPQFPCQETPAEEPLQSDEGFIKAVHFLSNQ